MAVIAAVIVVATARFVAVKLVVTVGMKAAMLATMGIGAMISMMRIVAAVDVAVPAARSVEPWACSYKDSARKPLRAIVAIRGTVVRRVVVIAVGAYRRGSNINAHGHLGFCR